MLLSLKAGPYLRLFDPVLMSLGAQLIFVGLNQMIRKVLSRILWEI